MRRAGAYCLFAALVALGRPASFNSPAGGDLGQYMYAGTETLDGRTPYVDFANNKGPATFALFALIRLVCGQSTVSVRIVLVLATALAALAVAGIVARHAGRAAGLLAGVVLSVLASAEGFEGPEPNNTHFGLLPMVGAWYLAGRPGARAALGAGAVLGIAVWMNPAFAVAAPFAAWELWRVPDGRGRRLLGAGAGLAAVSAVLLGWLAAGGALDDMFEQVFGKVSATVATEAAPDPLGAPEAPLQFLLDLPDPALWLVGLAGCAVAARDRGLRPIALAAAAWIVLGWLRVEIASYAFANQYLPVLAGIAIGIAAGVARVWKPGSRAALGALVLVPLAWTAVAEPQLRALSIPAASRGNAFAEPVAGFVEANTRPEDRIVVAETDAQIYWLADRRSSSRFFDSFGLAGEDENVAERRRDLAAHPPAAIAAVPDRLIDPDLQAVIDSGYRLAYDREGARVWLRR